MFRSASHSIAELKYIWQSVRQALLSNGPSTHPDTLSPSSAISERTVALIEKAMLVLGSPDLLHEPNLKNTWSIHLPDYRNGHVLLDVHGGKFSMQASSEGTNFTAVKSKSMGHAKPSTLSPSSSTGILNVSVLLHSWPPGSDEDSIITYFKEAQVKKATLVTKLDDAGSSIWALEAEALDRLLMYEGSLVAGRPIRFRVTRRSES